ncbi:hypothetical protein [Humisphaera borealis]|uniref:Molybdopterin oxidoreductase n=1 Tax=Humisphaera borealis TaxID=2807512 RepID=A0A7M2X1C9_9BACT|nr:hypothetical protein [Humisphaera borealis]QOV91548.1 hypothetical protein IPV69_09385 [Humisphaera borealis]
MNGTHAINTELISYRIPHLKVATPAVAIGGGALILAVILGFIGGWGNFMHAYLAAYLFWFGITIGCIALTMLHHLTGGRWGDVIRPLLETGTRNLILMFVLGIPILIFMRDIYPWAQPYEVLSTKLKHQYNMWTNPAFFIVRFVVYFLILGAMAVGLNRKYRLRDEMAVKNPADNTGSFFRFVSGPGMLVLFVVITFATIDWAMSVQAAWFSTIYGLHYMAGQGLSTVALMIIVIMLITRQWESNRADHSPLINAETWHDLGNLLFAFTMLWGYLSLSQMLIVYSGNLPFEAAFYKARSVNNWQYIGGAMIALHFFLPFSLLLMRNLKRDPKKLIIIAVLILLVRQIDFYYQIHPSYADGLPGKTDEAHRVMSAFGWHTVQNILTPVGIGGLWIAFFAWNLKDRRVLPAPAQEVHHG